MKDLLRLVQILAAGVGSVLIRREVVERFPFRIHDGEEEQFTDFNFYHDCYVNGIKCYVDTDIIAGHIHPDDEISGRNKWFNADTRKMTHTAPSELHNFLRAESA